jgi:hypothetical protein
MPINNKKLIRNLRISNWEFNEFKMVKLFDRKAHIVFPFK